MTEPGALIMQFRKELAESIVNGKESHELEAEARLLEDEIERRSGDVLLLYVFHLSRIVGKGAGDAPAGLWRLIRATPQQRAQAYLEATK